jgi:MFS superfamily sulfate permease-like transporter
VLDELFGDLIFFIYFFFFDNAESDLIPGFATFIACLVLPLQFGILVGIGINILFILYHAARPKITIENHQVSLCISAKY